VVRIVNCARGGLIDEAAPVEALKSKQVAARRSMVFETGRCRGFPAGACEPHSYAAPRCITAETRKGSASKWRSIRAAL